MSLKDKLEELRQRQIEATLTQKAWEEKERVGVEERIKTNQEKRLLQSKAAIDFATNIIVPLFEEIISSKIIDADGKISDIRSGSGSYFYTESPIMKTQPVISETEAIASVDLSWDHKGGHYYSHKAVSAAVCLFGSKTTLLIRGGRWSSPIKEVPWGKNDSQKKIEEALIYFLQNQEQTEKQ